jgi:hypothetical protein
VREMPPEKTQVRSHSTITSYSLVLKARLYSVYLSGVSERISGFYLEGIYETFYYAKIIEIH